MMEFELYAYNSDVCVIFYIIVADQRLHEVTLYSLLLSWSALLWVGGQAPGRKPGMEVRFA